MEAKGGCGGGVGEGMAAARPPTPPPGEASAPKQTRGLMGVKVARGEICLQAGSHVGRPSPWGYRDTRQQQRWQQ